MSRAPSLRQAKSRGRSLPAVADVDDVATSGFVAASSTRGTSEAQIGQGGDGGRAIGWGFLDEQVGILGRVREAKEDGAGFSDEQIPDSMPGENVANLLGLPILKRGHNPANRAGSARTSGGS